MKVLHVSDCYLPRLGGIEVQVHHLAKAQREAGDDVRVLTATPRAQSDPTRYEDVEGVPVIRANANLPFELPVHPRTGHEVRRALAEAVDGSGAIEVAHVHIGVLAPFAQAALPALIEAGVPTLVTVHSMWGPAWRGFAALDRWRHWSRWPVAFSAVSEVAAAPMRRINPDVAVQILPNGLDLDAWAPQPRTGSAEMAALGLDVPDDALLMVSAMRLAPRKRPRALLDVVRRLREQLDPALPVRLVIAGDGPLRTGLQRRVERAGLSDTITLTGRWPRERIRALYGRADVFVATAVLESFGIAALEARASGVPVLARDSTGAGEFVTDGVDGFLVPHDDAVLAALTRLARDAELRERVRTAARSVRPQASSWDQVLRAARIGYEAAITRSRADAG